MGILYGLSAQNDILLLDRAILCSPKNDAMKKQGGGREKDLLFFLSMRKRNTYKGNNSTYVED